MKRTLRGVSGGKPAMRTPSAMPQRRKCSSVRAFDRLAGREVDGTGAALHQNAAHAAPTQLVGQCQPDGAAADDDHIGVQHLADPAEGFDGLAPLHAREQLVGIDRDADRVGGEGR